MERVTLLGTTPTIDAALLATLATPGSVALPGATPAVAASSAPAPETTDDERTRIEVALGRAGGNVAAAARLLGIGRNALRYRMRSLGIDRPRLDAADPGGSAPAAPAPPAGASAPAAPRAASPVERKPVAVLVVAAEPAGDDEDGSADPWTAARRWEERLADKLTGFGGVLVERTPTRACAVFGAPLALERAAERALHAAFALARLADARGRRLRMALHFGEVRVAYGTESRELVVLPVADTMTLPERLQGHAGPGEILVSEPVARRVAHRCRLTARDVRLGPLDGDRVTAHVATPLTAPGPSGVPLATTLTPFVGRDGELDQVRHAFAEAREGRGQVVFVAGEAGIGKSRLLAELQGHLAGEPHEWIIGRCTPYGTATPFLPIAEALRAYLGIEDRDDDAAAAAKVASGFASFGADLAWTIPLVQQLLALPVHDPRVAEMDAVNRRSETSRALRELSLRLAGRTTLVLVVEDLHWIDSDSEQYLTFLAEAVPAARILLLLTQRPGYTHPFGDRSYHQRVALRPLPQAAVARMTESVLGAGELPASLSGLIAAKAEGNPFFVEEVTRSLLEDGAIRLEGQRVVLAPDFASVSVPDTIQEVLIARLERLGGDARLALQIASVIGREFALRLLARLLEAGDRVQVQVDELRSLELIYEKATRPELAYMFKHALTHDVAYLSVDASRRQALHRTIGTAIEELYADRLAEHYETLAHHFEAGDDWPRAFTYHRRATEKAAESFASRSVILHARAALAIADRLGDDVAVAERVGLLARLAVAQFYVSDFTAAGHAYRAAAALEPDSDARALHTVSAASAFLWGHDYQRTAEDLTTVDALVATHPSPPASAMAEAIRGFMAGVCRSDLAALERHVETGLTVLRRRPHAAIEAALHQHLALALEWSGDFLRAAASCERALVLAREARAPDVTIFATWFLGKSRCCLGDYAGALAVLREAYDVSDRIGDRAWKSRLLNTTAWCLAEMEQPRLALDYNARAASLAADIGDDEIITNAAVNLAHNHLDLGDPDAALRHLVPIEAHLAGADDPWMRWRYTLHVLHARAEYELRHGDPARALELSAAEIEGARRHHAPKLEARGLTLQGRVLLALGEGPRAATPLAQAATVAARVSYARSAWEVPALLAEVAHRRGREADATAHRERARAAARRLAARLTDGALASTLASAPDRLRF
jgi:tetratricopeptide (TPR) repeat protein